MYNIKRIGILTVFFASIICSIMCGESLAAKISTPQDYIDYLYERGKTNPDALKLRDQFVKLSLTKKKKFMWYITNREIMTNVLTELSSNKKGGKELYGGDIVIEYRTSSTENELLQDNITPRTFSDFISSLLVSEVYAAPTFKEHKVTHSHAANILGLKVMDSQNWVMYRSKSNKEVFKIISGGSYFHNLVPLYIVSKEAEERYIYGNKAHNCVVYKISPFLTPWTTVYHFNHHVLGFPNGSSTYRILL